ncbi:hypothetical protein AX15_003667 [Amanita polypyramis BW_CC]|nr:hypothetical protein AX15_003667 [Amanita polypyramis BW_CC]
MLTQFTQQSSEPVTRDGHPTHPMAAHTSLEMSWRQRAIVDTCFEEWQYESAIFNLEHLQSPSYRPSLLHVQQLIYIALHPISDAVPEKMNKSIYDSPSKLQQFAKATISSTAVMQAQQLLFSFTATQSPDILARALPSYEPSNTTANAAEDIGDSDISRESLCIKEAKDCWSLLVDGFLSRGKVLFSSPRRKSRRRREDVVDDLPPADDHMVTSRKIVAESAWVVLDWFLVLFERDEHLIESKGDPPFSPLLLAQIPPTRNGSGSRWDVAIPLAIVVFCLQQPDLSRQRMGARLMTLLINLSLTSHLNFYMFIASVYGRLSTVASENLYSLLSVLPPSLLVHRFKVALCYKFITELVPERTDVDNRLRPPARARKPRSRREGDQMQVGSTPTISSGNVKHLPPCQAVLNALETLPAMTDMTLFLRVKFELFISYGTIQHKAPASEKDVEWTNALQQRKLHSIVGIAFNPEGEDTVKLSRLANSIVSLWV